MRTLKEEEVHGTDYRDLEDTRSRIGEFLEQVYNRQRLHSALRYPTPEEFEQTSEARGSDGADGSSGKPKTKPKQADVSPINCLQACLSLGAQSRRDVPNSLRNSKGAGQT
jgi:hypothetical protein